MKDTKYKFRGVFVPMITCMTKNEELNEAGIHQFTNFLIENGVNGLIPTASNGEGPHLSIKEHKKAWDIVIDEANGRVPVLPCNTGNTTRDVVATSKYAEDIGASGLMIAPPYYYYHSEDDLYNHYKTIAESVNIPIMLYNDPWVIKTDMQPSLVAKLASEIENISYIKESTGDSKRIHQVIRAAGENITVFLGWCNIALEAFVLGAQGWITGLQNFLPSLAVKLFKLSVEQNDFLAARKLYYKMLPVCSFFGKVRKAEQSVKAALEMRGIPAGPARRPSYPITDEQKAELRTILEGLDILPT